MIRFSGGGGRVGSALVSEQNTRRIFSVISFDGVSQFFLMLPGNNTVQIDKYIHVQQIGMNWDVKKMDKPPSE